MKYGHGREGEKVERHTLRKIARKFKWRSYANLSQFIFCESSTESSTVDELSGAFSFSGIGTKGQKYQVRI
jgi:hypothetical protein